MSDDYFDPIEWLTSEEWLSHPALAKRSLGSERRWRADCFPEQSRFLDDESKIKAAVCGRRAGKTYACAIGLYEAGLQHPRSLCPYIALSRTSARRIVWPVLVELNERYKLGLQLSEHELVATLANGSKIFCVGGDDPRKVEALRGGKYARVVVDEAGSFPRQLLRYLCEDVLDAALLDLDGELWLVGSPNAACVGFFHDVTTGANPEVQRVSTHHWTVLENTSIPHAGRWLAAKRTAKQWAEDHPVYRREYLGHWVRDASSLVFRFDRSRHMVRSVDDEISARVLSVDLGSSPKEATSAFGVLGWSRFSRKVHVEFARKYAALTPATGAEELRRIMNRHGNVQTIVVDPGGLGGAYVTDWRRREGLPVEEAEKRGKHAAIRELNGELDAGNIDLLEGQTEELAGELELLQWDEDRDDFDPRFADHCADMLLYGWRRCWAWNAETRAPAPPLPGSLEALEREQREAKERAIQASMARDRRDFRLLSRQLRRR
jgi:hypothetical protein